MRLHFTPARFLAALSLMLAGTAASAQDSGAQSQPVDDALTRAIKRAAASTSPAPTPAAPLMLRELLPIGQSAPLGASAANRSAKLTIHSVSVRPSYGAAAPSPGSSLLVLDAEWENIIPLSFIYERQVPTAYQIPSLGDHLYLVINGRVAARLRPDADALAGHVPVRDFQLERIGAVIRGNLVFELPAEEVRTLELRFYDYAHGHFAIPLMEAEPGLIATLAGAKPLAPAAGNEVLDAGAFGFEKLAEIGGQKAPAGMTWIIADLRAQSKFTYDADATAFDPKAKPGDRAQIGTVADWTDAYQHSQLVLDGEYAYSPNQELSDLSQQPRFLPDVMTGGRLVFLAPEQFTSAELRAEMPNARTPSGAVIRPRGLTLALAGARPDPLPQRAAAVSIDDDVFHVGITGQSAPEEFAGARAGDGRRWLVLDVTVRNSNLEAGESFQTPEQLKIADSAGQVTAMDDASFAGQHPAAKLLLIPPGERRSFQVAYQVPAALTQPRLAYSGVSKAEMIELAPLDAVADANAGAMADAQKPETPAQPARQPESPARPPAQPNEQPGAQPGGDAARPAAPTAAADDALKPLKVDDREFPARMPAHPALEPRGLAGVGLTPEQVNDSIERGARGLWQVMKKDLDSGSRQVGGAREHVLILLALVHARAHEKDSEIDAAVRQFLATVDPNRTNETYENALLCMLVDAYGDPAYLPKLRAAAQWFVDSQGPEGTWNYRPRGPVDPKAAPPARRPLMVAGGAPPGELDRPLARVAPAAAGQDGDNSTTQYAILGLHAASRAGVKVPQDVWRRAAEAMLKRQVSDDGGWAYHDPVASYGSMTCAGICTLALARHEIGEDVSGSIEVERGLAWLNAHFAIAEHPPRRGRTYLYYYLYALERVGRVLDTEFLGEQEWYPLGARFLIDQQLADGTWNNTDGSEPVEHASSFALLFLTRATPSLKAEPKTGPGTLLTRVELPPGLRLHVILDCSGSMLEQMEGRPKFDIAREALSSLISSLPAGSEVALQAYGHRRRAIEANADTDTEILVRMTALKDEQAKDEMLARIASLRARGKTPLTASLEMASGAVGGGSADRPVTVVLLTDGGEDTFPRRDPVEAARRLVERPGVRLHVIGFDIDRADWVEQLRQMAAAGGGSYMAAAEAGALSRELASVVLGTPGDFIVFDEAGTQAGSGAFGSEHELSPGKYRLATTYAGGAFEQEFWVHAGAPTTVTFDPRGALEAIGRGEVASAQGAVVPSPEAPPATGPGNTGSTQPAAARSFCTKCGARVPPGARFCTSCGAKL